MSVSWYEVLEEMLIFYQGEKRRFSNNHSNVIAREGCEIPFQEADEKIRMIQTRMRDVRYGTKEAEG
jgi:hypothetical protein